MNIEVGDVVKRINDGYNKDICGIASWSKGNHVIVSSINDRVIGLKGCGAIHNSKSYEIVRKKGEFIVGDVVKRFKCGSWGRASATRGNHLIVEGVFLDAKRKSLMLSGCRKFHNIGNYELVTPYQGKDMSKEDQEIELNVINNKKVTLLDRIKVTTNTRDMFLSDNNGHAVITCGCFTGTIKQALDLAKDKERGDYIQAVELLTAIAIRIGLKREPEITPKVGQVWRNDYGTEFLVILNDENNFNLLNLKTLKIISCNNTAKAFDNGAVKFVRNSL